CPGAFETTGDGVTPLPALVTANPTQSHFFNGCRFGLGANVGGIARAVGFTKGVTTGGQRHSLVVVHRHARKGFANVARRGQRVGVAVRAVGVNVNQAHLHGGQGVFQIAFAGVTAVGFVTGGQPLVFGAPVDIFFGRKHVFTATGKA